MNIYCVIDHFNPESYNPSLTFDRLFSNGDISLQKIMEEEETETDIPHPRVQMDTDDLEEACQNPVLVPWGRLLVSEDW